MDRKTKYTQRLALLLSLLLILTATLGTTLAIVVTKTPSIINTFLSGIAPTGNLTIQKTISHPFGDNYTIPDNENTRFTFDVALGTANANQTFGDFQTDGEGRITQPITIRAGGSVTIPNLPTGTEATVTERQPGQGFAAADPQTVTIRFGENRLPIVNPYIPAAASTEDLTVKGSKTLAGRDWQEGDRFAFALEVRENGSWKELGQQEVAYVLTEQPDPDDPDKTIWAIAPDFNTFDFSQTIRQYPLDKAGVYSFRVIEKEGSIGGITYDKAESRFDVTVGDQDMDGYLEIRSIVSPSANTWVDLERHSVRIHFQNEYAPLGSDDVSIDITKELTDTSGQNKAPYGFTFELYDQEGNLIQTSEPTDSDGRTDIRLIYETKHAGQSFLYTLKEVNDGQRGVDYDETVYTFRVDVSGCPDGTISASIRECDPGENVSDDDMQEEPPETEPTEPEPTESAPSETEPTEPEPTESAAPETEPTEPEPTESAPPETEPTEPEPTESTPPETEATEPEPTESEPLASEPSESEPTEPEAPVPATTEPETVESESVYSEVASDTDEGPQEQLSKRVTAVFTNTYSVKAASLPITGSKKLTGRTMNAGEFTFQLYETEAGFAIPEGADPARTAENAADGTFAFDALTFNRRGWYYYVVQEDTTDPMGGIIYDESRYQIRVFVEDVGGALSVQDVTVENTAGEPADLFFHNTYVSENAIFSIIGQKILDGRELKPEEFTFHLYEASYLTSYGFTKGQLYARSANDLDVDGEVTGEFSFRIEYPAPGTYHYIIAEAAGEETGMTYDDTEYGIEVVVRDDQAGQLQAQITRLVKLGEEDTEVEKILFHNTYTAPEAPDETIEATTEPEDTTQPDGTAEPENSTETKLPQTGQLWWPVPILLLLGVLFVLIGLIRRRGNRYDC